jgi:hypothetical protein
MDPSRFSSGCRPSSVLRAVLIGAITIAACGADEEVGQTQLAGCDCPPVSSSSIPSQLQESESSGLRRLADEPNEPCCCDSPIVLDLAGDGVRLTGWQDGVRFALHPLKPLDWLGWTSPGSDDAWLALDKNKDGVITDGTELFGNITAQAVPPPGQARNGFLALAQYDGDGNRVIDERDPVFDDLRAWQDKNHDGVSQPDELRTLAAVGVTGLSVAYNEIRERDSHGNLFRYSAPVQGLPGSTVGMTAWDALLTHPVRPAPPPRAYSLAVVLDLAGDGVQLTTWQDGVIFDLRPGKPIGPWAWTQPGSDDAWLVLDNDEDDDITNGTELFGDYMPQPNLPTGVRRNGFLALTQFDVNADQIIDEKDADFERMRVWQDQDHDGVSQPEELRPLLDAGIASISVVYSEVNRPDGRGNLLKHTAAVHETSASAVGMTAYDVMVSGPSSEEWNYGPAPKRSLIPPKEEMQEQAGYGYEMGTGASLTPAGIYSLHGGKVHRIANGMSRVAEGWGWWTRDANVTATMCEVKVQMKAYDTSWRFIGPTDSDIVPYSYPDTPANQDETPPHVPVGTYTNIVWRTCNQTNVQVGWKHTVDGDLVGALDISRPYASDEVSIYCDPFTPPPDPPPGGCPHGPEM